MSFLQVSSRRTLIQQCCSGQRCLRPRPGSRPARAPVDHGRPGFGPVPVQGVVGHDHGIDVLVFFAAGVAGHAAVPKGKNVAAVIVFGRVFDGVLFEAGHLDHFSDPAEFLAAARVEPELRQQQ